MPFGASLRFCGSIPKLIGDADRNEDAAIWSSERSAAALSDGASESFDSRLWANILVRLFILKQNVTTEAVDLAIAAFAHCHEPEAMSWSRKAAYDRGSFATLLGITFGPEPGAVRVLAIGDTVAVLLDGARPVKSFPYTDPDEFQQRPTLLSTRRAHNRFVDRPGHAEAATATWRLDALAAPRIACMTDALGEWFLRRAADDPCAGETLLGLDVAGLEALVAGEREAGRMRVDDSTLLILE